MLAPAVSRLSTGAPEIRRDVRNSRWGWSRVSHVGDGTLQGARRARERLIFGDRATTPVSVAVAQATAFDVFTREIDLWWRRGGSRARLRFTSRELARGFNYYLGVLTLYVVSAVVYADVIG